MRDEAPGVDAPSLATEPRHGRRREARSGAGSVRLGLGAEEGEESVLRKGTRRLPSVSGRKRGKRQARLQPRRPQAGCFALMKHAVPR